MMLIAVFAVFAIAPPLRPAAEGRPMTQSMEMGGNVPQIATQQHGLD
jgi:hypothetical protein